MSTGREGSDVEPTMTPDRPSSFEDSFDDLATVAQRVAYRLLGDRHDAEEAGQEALARAYLRWRRVAPYAEAWVARVAANLALDLHRSRARRRRYEAAVGAVAPASSPDEAGELVSRAELVAGLRSLPRRQRDVVVLRYVADLSEKDTAAALGCSAGTVKQHASRGLAALRLTVPDPSRPEPTAGGGGGAGDAPAEPAVTEPLDRDPRHRALPSPASPSPRPRPT